MFMLAAVFLTTCQTVFLDMHRFYDEEVAPKK